MKTQSFFNRKYDV